MDHNTLTWFPKELIAELIAIANVCINKILLPCVAKDSETCLLPKNDTDERPIGLMATLYRLLSRLFKEDLRAFDK